VLLDGRQVQPRQRGQRQRAQEREQQRRRERPHGQHAGPGHAVGGDFRQAAPLEVGHCQRYRHQQEGQQQHRCAQRDPARVGGQGRQQLPAYPGMQRGQQAEDGQQRKEATAHGKPLKEDTLPGTGGARPSLPESKHMKA